MSSYQSNQIKLINTSLIDPHPDNPRKNIGDVNDLAASIKTNGLLTPLSVVPNGERYQGHRRPPQTRRMQTGRNKSRPMLRTPARPIAAARGHGHRELPARTAHRVRGGRRHPGHARPRSHHRRRRAQARPKQPTMCVTASRPPASRPRSERSRDDFCQISIGQLVAIARYDGQSGSGRRSSRRRPAPRTSTTPSAASNATTATGNGSNRSPRSSGSPTAASTSSPTPKSPTATRNGATSAACSHPPAPPKKPSRRSANRTQPPYPSTRSRSRSTSGPAATRPPTPKRKPDAPPNKPNATPAGTRSRNTPPHPRTSAWHGSTANLHGIKRAQLIETSGKARTPADHRPLPRRFHRRPHQLERTQRQPRGIREDQRHRRRGRPHGRAHQPAGRRLAAGSQ